jgi:vacuolar-type H+-ATPase subunit E/Vma4
MMTSNPNAPAALREEILAEARRAAEEILHHARQEAGAALAKAQVEADQNRDARLALAHSEAGHRREMLLATVPTETERLRSAAIERLLQSIRDEAKQRLSAREGFDYPAALVGLAAQAIAGMVGTAFVVKLSAADYAAFGKALTMKLPPQLGKSSPSITVAGDPAMAGDGVIIQNAEGYQVWDNRFETRLERLWPELRRQIAVQTLLVAASNPTGGGA